MAEEFLPDGVAPPDFYIAAMGRSGSTLLCNWLSRPPEEMVFIEPSFLSTVNTRLLRTQLADFGMPVPDDDWQANDPTATARFRRLMGPRLRGRRWAVKEVLCSEHEAAISVLRPPKVIISVRSIDDVALSFFEKHRVQDNLDRFSDEWVVDYCQREAAGLVDLHDSLAARGIPALVVRYEDFSCSDVARRSVADFTGWRGHGKTDAHLAAMERGFEVERHGSSISGRSIRAADRRVDRHHLEMAGKLRERCSVYQLTFGY